MTETSTERYQLESRIATGGMGEVWQATDTVLGREVALKILRPEYADDPAFRARFQQEARSAAALHHPNVASVFDFGELPPEHGSGVPRPYLVMELVPGEPLSKLLRGGEPMPPDTAVALIAQAADALAAAHARGIVHRDIKPGNVLVTPDRRVKITDFGIARAADASVVTQTGQVLGTPAYISPEQAQGQPTTPASDVYALGVVLYECLAGERPFRRDTAVATAFAHLHDDPPPLPETVPQHLRDVVSVAMAKEPADRFPSMEAFAAALRGAPVAGLGAATAATVPAPAGSGDDHTRVLPAAAPAPLPPPGEAPLAGTRRRRPPWLPWALAALGVLLLVVLVTWLGRGDEGGADQSPSSPTTSRAPADSEQPSTPADTTPPPEQTPTPTPTPEEPSGIEVVAEDYVGLSADDATDRLEDLGLEVAEQEVANDGSIEEGVVTGVEPTGTLQEGDTVTLLVAGPPPEEGEDNSGPGNNNGNGNGNGFGNNGNGNGQGEG